MLAHHEAWLKDHPERTAEWLKDRLGDGFEVHHIDGNHENNHPHNLALIEWRDHYRLHGIFRLKRHASHFQKMAKLGAVARMAKITPAKRRKIARNAAVARWGGATRARDSTAKA